VRVSFPLATLGAHVASGALPSMKEYAHRSAVLDVLDRADQTGVKLSGDGLRLAQWMRQRGPALYDGIPEKDRIGFRRNLLALQRLHQLSPSDESMFALDRLGLRSAHDVVAFDRESFLARYGKEFPDGEAELVWRKASQGVAVVHSALASFRQLFHGAPLAATSISTDPAAHADEVAEARAALQDQYPNLEGLFGPMDFCPCDHCRSVLSPAAYLVDLFRFLDADAKEAHPGLTTIPYDVLMSRRPDLSRIPLTCENTNTELPFIDVVNEVLEDFVANGSVTAAAAHDSGDAPSADLVAEPQNLNTDAYDKLKASLFPIGSPFDLQRERIRAFLDALELPWARVFAAMQPQRDLTAVSETYLETVRLGPEERRPFAVQPASWFLLYGYSDAATAQSALLDTQGRAFARKLANRLGVTYVDLDALVRAVFVNPELHDLVLLRKAGVTVLDVKRARAPSGNPLAFDPSELQAYLGRLEAAKTTYDFDFKGAIDALWTNGTFTRIAAIFDPLDECRFDRALLAWLDGTQPFDGFLLRLNLFVRVWRKLGWTVDETDQLLVTALPPDEPDSGKAYATALTCAGIVEELARRLSCTREAVLAFYGDLPTRGNKPLYDRLFLTPPILKTDPVFDDPLGNYLSKKPPLKDHLAVVQAALGVSASDLGEVADVQNAILDLNLLGTVYRLATLSKGLDVTIPELLASKELTQLDPFQPLHRKAPADLDGLVPWSCTLRFVQWVSGLEARGFDVAQLRYLAAHDFDEGSPQAATEAVPFERLHALRDALTAIDNQLELKASDELSADVLRPILTVVLPAPDVAELLAMWTGTREYLAASAAPLDPLDFKSAPRFSVRSLGGKDYLVHKGVVTPRIVAALKAAAPGHDALVDDLATASNAFVERQGWVHTGDLDTLFPDPDGLTPADRLARNQRLLDRLLPVARAALTRSALARVLGGDPAIDNVILAQEDPTNSRATLAGAFEDARLRGVTVTFLDGTNHPRSSTETGVGPFPADPLPSGTTTVSLAAWFVAPGPLTFHVGLSPAAATATLRVNEADAPLGGAPPYQADVALTAGVWTKVDLEIPAGTEVKLEVSGDGLPQTAFDNLAPCPADAVERVRLANVLFTKTSWVAATLRLSADELGLLLHDTLVLDGTKPLRLLTASPPASDAAATFLRLERMAAYVALRDRLDADPALFLALATASTDSERLKASKTLWRDRAGAFSELVKRFGAPVTLESLERAAEGLEVVQRLRPSLTDLFAWTSLPLPADAEQRIRDLVRSRFTARDWRTFARPIFDRLRKLQRDALVAYSLQKRGRDRVEELFGDFLFDPATEPVVLTSRIQMAIASVQTFIQRCFLNLESDVPPEVLNANRWKWKSRYRVWEAARKIFLFPENLPALRDDATHLFNNLASSLLQGDVSDELVEKAFYEYLHGLEEISRLEIVSTQYQAAKQPEDSVLHVLGRTHSNPRKYFYRAFQGAAWSPWLPLQMSIEGDHVCVAFWRDRVHVFWVTITDKPSENEDNAGHSPQDLGQNSSVGEMKALPQVQLQLHWVELFKGKWINKKSTDLLPPLDVPADFDRSSARISVRFPPPAAIAIRLDWGPSVPVPNMQPKWPPGSRGVAKSYASDLNKRSFGVAHPSATVWSSAATRRSRERWSYGNFHVELLVHSKYAPVEQRRSLTGGPPRFPISFSARPGEIPTGIRGEVALEVRFGDGAFVLADGSIETSPADPQPILTTVATDPVGDGVATAVPPNNVVLYTGKDLGGLLSPFFLHDRHHTFYVEPTLALTPIEQVSTYVPPPPVVVARPAAPVIVREIPKVIDPARKWSDPVTDALARSGGRFRHGDLMVGGSDVAPGQIVD